MGFGVGYGCSGGGDSSGDDASMAVVRDLYGGLAVAEALLGFKRMRE